MNKLPVFTKRADGKIATTTYVNQVADLAMGASELYSLGQIDDRRKGLVTLPMVVSARLTDQWYTATIKEGPAILTVDDTDPIIRMDDGNTVLVFSPTSLLSAGDLICSLLIGLNTDLNAEVYMLLSLQQSAEFEFDARITSSAQISTRKAYTYEFAKIHYLGTGIDDWEDEPDGLTGICFNRTEMMNGTTGPLGNGGTAPFIGTFDLIPCPVNNIVRMTRLPIVDSTEFAYRFSYENLIDGDC